MTTPPNSTLPFKSTAVALIFSTFLGPIGLLYASFWGGLIMMVLAVYFVCSSFFFITLLVWLGSCLWSVRAVESYNKKILKTYA